MSSCPDSPAVPSSAASCRGPLLAARALPGQLDCAAFRLHDVGAFPLVRICAGIGKAGFAFAWRAEMQRLVGRAEPFVLVDEALVRAGRSDDTRMCAHWLRVNRAALGACCGGMIVVEPEVARRIATRRAALDLTLGTGLRIIVVSTPRVALELVPVLLKLHGGAPRTPPFDTAGPPVVRRARRSSHDRR